MSAFDSILQLCRRGLTLAEQFLAQARHATARQVQRDGRVDAALVDIHQLAAHGFAWQATYVEALRQSLLWATGLRDAGLGVEIFARQIGKTEFVVGGEFPGQVQVDFLRQSLGLGNQLGGCRFFELEQHIGCLHFDAFARIQLDLHRTIGFRHHAAGEEFSGVIEQSKHMDAIVADQPP